MPPKATLCQPSINAILADSGHNTIGMDGGFTGASRLARELASWSPGLVSADADLLHQKDMLDARSIDLINNDAYVKNGVRTQNYSIVGAHFRLVAHPNAKMLGLGEQWATEFQEYCEETFSALADSADNLLDATRKNTFTEMIRLAVCLGVGVGQVLALAEWNKNNDSPYRTSIRFVDSARLSTPKDKPDLILNKNMRKGVLHNDKGVPIKYFIQTSLQGDGHLMDEITWQDFPSKTSWGRKIVLHYFEQQRVDQSHGIGELVSALKEMRMLNKYSELVLQNAALNASFAATIESELPPTEAYQALTGPTTGELANSFLNNIAAYSSSATNLHIDGIKIPHLYPNTKLNLKNAGQPGGLGSSFEESLLRKLAASFDLSYEEFSKDFSKTNYSSGRASTNKSWQAMMVKKKIWADRMGADIYRLFFEEEFASGRMQKAGVLPRNPPNFYEGLNKEYYTQCSFIGAARGQIDELKETNSAILRVKNNLSTLETECARFGSDWRKVMKQRKREMDLLKELGIPDELTQDKTVTDPKTQMLSDFLYSLEQN